MTKRVRSQVQASKMRFIRRIEGVTLFNKVRSFEIRKSLNIEPLLLRIERSQLRWFGHASRKPQKRLPKQALLAKLIGEDQLDYLVLDGPITLRILNRIDWGYSYTQAKRWMFWKTLKCDGLISSCCPRNPHGKAGNDETRRTRRPQIYFQFNLRTYCGFQC